MWAHAFAFHGVENVTDVTDQKTKSKFQEWQYNFMSSTGSGSMFTDVLKALCAGQEVLVILDEFHAIYEAQEFSQSEEGAKYQRRLRRFVEYLAVHPNVRLAMLTATPVVNEDATQIYANTLVQRTDPQVKDILKHFHGSHTDLHAFSSTSLLGQLGFTFLHKINGQVTSMNTWHGGKGMQRLPACTLPALPNAIMNTTERDAFNLATAMKAYEGVLIYQHGPNRIQRTLTADIECINDGKHVSNVKALRTFFGDGVTFIQIGSKVCHLPRDTDDQQKHDRIGQHLSYAEIAHQLQLVLRSSGTDQATNSIEHSVLLMMCDRFVTNPHEPSASGWFLRFLIKAVIAAIRMKHVRDKDQQKVDLGITDPGIDKHSPCRTLIMLDEDFDGTHDREDITDELKNIIKSYHERAEIVLKIIQSVYDLDGNEKIAIVPFSQLCKKMPPASGRLKKRDYSALIGAVTQQMLKTQASVPQAPATGVMKITNACFIPTEKKIGAQVKCILSQGPTTRSSEVAHIYITSMKWKKSVDLKQFALQQILANVKTCAEAKQALGRIRRLNCMKGPWPGQDHSRLELYLDDVDLNVEPFSKAVMSENMLLENCNVYVKPRMAVLFCATNAIGDPAHNKGTSVPVDDFEEYNQKEYNLGYMKNNDYSISLGTASEL